LKPFNKETFRKRFWETDKDKPNPTTIDSLRYIRNRFENFKPDANVQDGTVSFLKKFPHENQLHG
jgi:hypothetical protein